eukprot:GFYU01008440.1.p1 GENE.GFYU01008440.1~~GFYU01008440.1.p1  ORF type:complete len:370 (-),score=98.15 GFYU01008440.1:681-1790(-)
MSSADEARRKEEKPNLPDVSVVLAFVKEKYGLDVDTASVKEMDSYDDRNYYVKGYLRRGGDADVPLSEFTIKVHNGVESVLPKFIEAQNQLLQRLESSGVTCPVPLASLASESEFTTYLPLPLRNDSSVIRAHAVRVLTFVKGHLMNDVLPCSMELYEKVGAFVGRMDKGLLDFHSDALERNLIWDMKNFMDVAEFIPTITEEKQQAQIHTAMTWFKERVLSRADKLRQSVLQNDSNTANIIVKNKSKGGDNDVAGIIDFGDCVKTYIVNELAICIAYSIIHLYEDADMFQAVKPLLKGYMSSLPLTEDELAALPTLVIARIATSVTLGAYSYSQDPGNEYLLFSAKPGWCAMTKIVDMGIDEFEKLFR